MNLDIWCVGNQLPILLISFHDGDQRCDSGWESVTNPLDKLYFLKAGATREVGNQLPILLISFGTTLHQPLFRWESVTNPLDKLLRPVHAREDELGISYQSS